MLVNTRKLMKFKKWAKINIFVKISQIGGSDNLLHAVLSGTLVFSWFLTFVGSLGQGPWLRVARDFSVKKRLGPFTTLLPVKSCKIIFYRFFRMATLIHGDPVEFKEISEKIFQRQLSKEERIITIFEEIIQATQILSKKFELLNKRQFQIGFHNFGSKKKPKVLKWPQWTWCPTNHAAQLFANFFANSSIYLIKFKFE